MLHSTMSAEYTFTSNASLTGLSELQYNTEQKTSLCRETFLYLNRIILVEAPVTSHAVHTNLTVNAARAITHMHLTKG